LDIPLLFEGKAERRVDMVVVVTCPAFLQRQRVLARPGMTLGKLDAISKRQMPDWEKRRRADAIIPTGAGRRAALRRLLLVVTQLREDGQVRRRPVFRFTAVPTGKSYA
jgi:dephospho-CoA kinase